MNATDFNKKITAAQLNESMFKKFGAKIDFDRYTREELENYRNILRTKIHQAEVSNNFNELLTNETYQKDKFMITVLNTKIKEMLGESAANNKDTTMRINTLEGKKSKPDFLDMDKDGNKKEPMKKAVADKKKNPFAKVKENFPTVDDAKKAAAGTSGMKTGDKKKSSTGGTITKVDDKTIRHTAGKNYGGADAPRTPDSDKKSKKVKEALKGGQNKLDVDKDGKLEKSDFAKLRAKKKVKESTIIFRRHVAIVNESLSQLLAEDEEGKAKAITAASDMVNDFTTWMQRIGQYQTKSMIELADAIRADFGQAEAEAFKQAVGPALSSALETLTQQREAVSHAVAVLAGEATDVAPMGMDASGMGDELAPSPEDEMNTAPMDGDEFGASDAASGGAEASGREMRESRQNRKLSEGHMLMSKLSR